MSEVMHLPLKETIFTMNDVPLNANEAALVLIGNPTDVVTNGDFATDSDWTKGTGWSIGSGVATKAPGFTGVLNQNVPAHDSDIHFLQFEITSHTANVVTPSLAGDLFSGRSAVGLYADVTPSPSSNTLLALSANSLTDLSLDNVEVYNLNENVIFTPHSPSSHSKTEYPQSRQKYQHQPDS